MSFIKRLFIASKAAAGRPLSRQDIYSYCDGLIKQPPIPPEWREAFSKTFAKIEGVPLTVEDYYREQLLRPSLDRITTAPTRAMQREACIQEVLTDMHWRTWYSCYNEAKTDAGRAMVHGKLKQVWPKNSPQERINFLVHFYMMALAVQGVLMTIGTGLLGLTNEIEMQIEVCRVYAKDIMMLDVNIMDYIYEQHGKDFDAAYALAGWKDDYLNPITTRMLHFLEATRKRIALGTFNASEFHAATQKFEAEKEQLAGRVRSGELF
jgi:hypothetical protein